MQIQITRLGTCKSCGECCRHNDPFLGLPIQCTFYDAKGKDGFCKIYPVRPDVCRLSPIAPRDVAMLPDCSYSFVDDKGVKVDMYMLKSTEHHLNVAVQRRRLLAQNNSRRGR